jgi:hypothetical protein
MTAAADEPAWRAVGAKAPADPPASRIGLGRPVPARPMPAASAPAALGTPVPVRSRFAERPPAGGGSPSAAVVRAQGTDEPPPPLVDGLPAPGGLCGVPVTCTTTCVCTTTCCSMMPACGGCWPSCLDGLCTPDHQLYGRAEYLLWTIRDHHLPPLVTTSNPPSSLGVLGEPGTRVLFGGSVDPEERSGGRFTLGWWFDPCCNWAIEGTFLFLGERSNNFRAASAGEPVLARPFFDVTLNEQNAELVANPALPEFPDLIPLTGGVDIALWSELTGAELNLRRTLLVACNGAGHSFKVDLIGGFRYLRLHEGLRITEALSVPATADPDIAGVGFVVTDQFGTKNQFYGGQLGAEAELRRGRWFIDFRGKVALGSTTQVVNIDGATTFTAPGRAPATSTGGLLAQPTNIGHYRRDTFSVVPEVGINVGCYVTPNLRISAGYTFLYWTNVARPGEQIDFGVNPNQLPRFNGNGGLDGPARPVFLFKDTDFWAHGVNFALEYRY